MLFACTAPPISLRVYLLAVAARETRFHARGLQRRRKRRREAVVVDVDVKESVPNMHARRRAVPMQSRRPRAPYPRPSCQSIELRQSQQKKENPELLTS